MECKCNIPVNFSPECSIVDVEYCGVEVPVSNIIFVNELPSVGDRDQLYVLDQSIYKWDNNLLKFIPIAGDDFIEKYFTDPLLSIIFDGGDADVILAVLDDTILE